MDLIITPVGDNSLHTNWIKNVNADICLIYYGNEENKFINTSKYYFKLKGSKWNLCDHALNNIDYMQYEYIWFPDDDIEISSDDINYFFEYNKKNNFNISQPSMSLDSFYSWDITLNKKNFGHRDVNFIEIMAPCFKLSTLEKIKKYFLESCSSFGWGLDFIYSYESLKSNERLAIIDEIKMRHAKKDLGSSYDRSIAEKNMFNFLFKNNVPFYKVSEI